MSGWPIKHLMTKNMTMMMQFALVQIATLIYYFYYYYYYLEFYISSRLLKSNVCTKLERIQIYIYKSFSNILKS